MIGLVTNLTQAGIAFGLSLFVPLGDIVSLSPSVSLSIWGKLTCLGRF